MKSAYLRTKLIRAALMGETFKGPDVVYVGLHSEDPGLTGRAEVQQPDYKRQPIKFGGEQDGKVHNTTGVSWPGPTVKWPELTHYSYWDSQAGGDLLYAEEFVHPYLPSVGIPITIPVGNLHASET